MWLAVPLQHPFTYCNHKQPQSFAPQRTGGGGVTRESDPEPLQNEGPITNALYHTLGQTLSLALALGVRTQKLRKIDSTIAFPHTSDYLQRTSVSWLLDTKKDTRLCKEKCMHTFFLCAKAYRSMTSGCRGTAYFPRRYDRELVFKTGDFSLK